MRPSLLALSIAFVALASVSEAGVLLPESYEAESKPNLGLLPFLSENKKKTEVPAAMDTPKIFQDKQTTKEKTKVDRFIDDLSRVKINNKLPNGKTPKTLQEASRIKQSPSAQQKQRELENLTNQIFSKPKTSYKKHTLSPGGIVQKKELTTEEKYYLAQQKIPKLINENSRRIQQAYKAYEDAFQKKISRPPLIQDEIDTSSLEGASFLEKKIRVMLSPEYIWGEQDIKRIKRAFGYDGNEIPKQCQLLYKIDINTDNGYRMQKIWSGKTETVKYNGAINDVSGSFLAVCMRPSALPQKGSIITRMGSYYGIRLPSSEGCAPEDKWIRNLSIKYLGNGKTSCRFD